MNKNLESFLRLPLALLAIFVFVCVIWPVGATRRALRDPLVLARQPDVVSYKKQIG
ncbi:putative membrane protein [Xanthomonas translucens pv. poae]|uniref:Putative membrane protein n=1 Tax=Xanthomonas graminis pv. poae TaxID=227946 RepID=A0A0K3A4Y0_9XANT|nr:hypothetical protein [Xanthomonas translucens]UKE63132.1 hypothetical protein KM539_06600 [Xanthomonas translucens pv. poae]CTP93226.1 putative membrane protein [Xanthomonas translucens pv. poae]